MGFKASFQSFVNGRRENQILRERLKHSQALERNARRMHAHAEHLSILLSSDVEVSRNGYVGNAYQSYSTMVIELDKKYRAVADWGNFATKSAVDVRGAFTIGQGVKPFMKKPGSERELQFITEFLQFNNLDQEDAQDWASEAELEGKFLARLFVNAGARQIEVRHIPWISQRYTVMTPGGDYKTYERVEYSLNDSGVKQTVDAPFFVYKRFGGRVHNVNETPPKIGMVLTAIENLDKSLWDWRKINHLFSGPTPYFKEENSDKAKATQKGLQEINWKIGKALVGTADFSLVGPNGQGISDMIEREILTYAKIISGGISIPVHFLGFPDLMSNRATADNLMELVQAGTSRERSIWIGFYEELFKKAIVLANENLNAGLNPEAIGCQIPFITAAKMQEIVNIWLPLYTAGALSLQTLVSKIPEVDVEAEMAAIAEEAQVKLDRIKEEADARGQEDPAMFQGAGQ